MDLIKEALSQGRPQLSEYESKRVLAEYGVPITRERLVTTRSELDVAIKDIGFPMVLKGSSSYLAHKTEHGLIVTDIRTEDEAIQAFQYLVDAMTEPDAAVLVQEKIKSPRELMAGMIRDPQFGPTVMFGLGGIFSEILKDACFRVAPLERGDAHGMMSEIRGHRILESIRGLPPADRERLADIILSLSRIGLEHDTITEIDINPIMLRDNGAPIAVDALIVLKTP
jgi:acetate---CoA ligase (ADP-forming) subunit beta